MYEIPVTGALFSLVYVPPAELARYTLYPVRSVAAVGRPAHRDTGQPNPSPTPRSAEPGAVVSGRVALTVADRTDSLPAASTAVTW